MAFRASSYSRYTGVKSKRPAWVPVMFSTWGRGWKSKWVRRITTMSLLLAIALTLLLYALNVAIPDWRTIAQSLGEMGVAGDRSFQITNATYLGLLNLYIHPFLLPLSLLFGYDLIAGDLRTNALEAYFARPLTPWGYLFGRTAAYAGFLLAVGFFAAAVDLAAGFFAAAALAEHTRDAARRFSAAGGTIALGTDCGAPGSFHGANGDELSLMVSAGLAPTEVLRAATLNGAALMGLDDLGRIGVGARASLLLVKGDPSRDIAAVADVENHRGVWHQGDRVAGT